MRFYSNSMCDSTTTTHTARGLSNDLLSHYWDWLEERVEPLTGEETQARNMSILAEIAVEEKDDELMSHNDVLSGIVQDQIDINLLLRQRGLETKVRRQLLICKATIQSQEVEARKILR